MKHPVYFPHDANASHDPKILALRKKYSFYGYGIYWFIIEYLRDQPGYKIPKQFVETLDFLVPPEELFGNDEIKVSEIINYCVEVGLFISDNGYFYSDSLTRRMREIEVRTEEFREAGRRGAAIRWNKENSPPNSPLNTPPMANKVKESKVKESKENICFDTLWEKYPNKSGKVKAQKLFEASVKSEQDQKDVEIAIENYIKSRRVAKGFVQNGSTWFGNWRDWLTYKETACPKCKGDGKITHSYTGEKVNCPACKGKGIAT